MRKMLLFDTSRQARIIMSFHPQNGICVGVLADRPRFCSAWVACCCVSVGPVSAATACFNCSRREAEVMRLHLYGWTFNERLPPAVASVEAGAGLVRPYARSFLISE